MLDLWKYGFLRPKLAADYKDAVDVWSKAASSAILLTGAVLSYFRFFYGRTLSRRADVALAVTSILDPRGDRLHSAIVTVKNVGTVTIWHPKPSIEVRLHCDARPEGSPSLQVTVERVQSERLEDVHQSHRAGGKRLLLLSGEYAECELGSHLSCHRFL